MIYIDTISHTYVDGLDCVIFKQVQYDRSEAMF